MSCRFIQDNNGEITGALTQTGERSKLYDQLNEQFGKNKAVELFAVSESDEFQEIFGGVKKQNKDTLSKKDSKSLKKLLDFKTDSVTIYDDNATSEILIEQLSDGEVSLHISEIWSDIKGQGSGTKLLNKLKYFSNEFYVPLSLRASTNNNIRTSDGINQENLVKWYEKNGFYISEEDNNFEADETAPFMVYQPTINRSQEPTVENLLRYIAEENKTTEKLTKEQLVDLQDFSNFDRQKLFDTFYDNNGLFIVNENKLTKSGLYSPYEAGMIAMDMQLQQTIKDSLERLKNTSEEELNLIETNSNREMISEFNSFGKLVTIEGVNEENDEFLLYRSGNLVTKAEDAYTMIGNRGSGHFGTGFYFFGDKKDADSYDKRQTTSVNISNYKLLRPKNGEKGIDLHEALKGINNFRYQNNIQGIANSVVNDYELDFYKFKDKINFESFDKWIVGNKEVEDFLLGKNYNTTPFDKNETLTNEILTEYKNEFENQVKKLEKELDSKVNKLISAFKSNSVDISESKKINIKKQVQNYNVDEYSNFAKGKDTLGTQILKYLGFEGINSKGIFELDNSLFGSVIFDIKPNTISNQKQAEVFVDVNGEIRPKRNTETELILPITAKETENSKVTDLNNLSLSTLQENEELTRQVLDEIENELIKDSMDVIGLTEKPIDENLKDFISVLDRFIKDPTTENTKLFAEKSDEYFKRDLTPKKETVVGEDGKEYVKLNTELSEEEVYNQQGLIKVDDNTYLKTAKEDLATLYENVRTYKEKYPKDKTLEEYVQEQIANYSFKDAEVAEAVVLYKMYFSNLTKADVIGKLKATKLAENVYEMTNAQIEAKLVELGVDVSVAKQVVAYHGSPYSFDRFTTNAMGTGEGAQAFGWGLYFTDLESIARNYADKLTGVKAPRQIFRIALEQAIKAGGGKNNFNREKALEFVRNQPTWVTIAKDWVIKAIEENNIEEIQRNLYKVSLHKGKTPSEYTWLEWDKEIPDNIYNSVGRKLQSNGKFLNELFQDSMEFEKTDGTKVKGNKPDGLLFYKRISQILGSDKDASLWLLSQGIDGIKYPSESISRGATSDTARGFNYVVFDENAITIEEQIQFKKIDLITNGFVYNGDVYLNTDSVDLITPIHEFNHLYNKWLKENREDVYMQGLSLIEKEINNPNSEIKDIIEFVKTNQPNLSGEKLKEEILTELVGRRGLELINSNKKSDLVSWLKSAWESIQDMLGLSNYSSNQIAKMNLIEFSTASAVDLLRGNPIVNQTSNFIGNYQYLTEEFPSDFYSKFLAEKKLNSKLFRNFYSNFEINEKGINLINKSETALRNIKIYADENLKQYSLISKQLPDLAEPTDNISNPRVEAVNNPQKVKESKENLYKLNENEIIIKNETEDFVKVNNEIYESVAKQGNLNHFVKLETSNSDYYAVNVEAPQTNLKLSDYNYLNETINSEKFKTKKDFLKGENPDELSC